MGACRGFTTGPFLILLIQLLTQWEVTDGRSVSESSILAARLKPNGPATRGVLVEEIILAGGVNNSRIPGNRIIRDPGGIKERLLSSLLDSDETPRENRSTAIDQASSQTQTLIINLASAKDVDNLQDILALADYEPQRIDGKKVKRKIPQGAADRHGSASGDAEATTVKSGNLSEKSDKKGTLISKPTLTARRKVNSGSFAEEDKDSSTFQPSTTQRIKRKSKKVNAEGSSENGRLADSYESDANVSKATSATKQRNKQIPTSFDVSTEETKKSLTRILRNPSELNAALLDNNAESTVLASSSVHSQLRNEGKDLKTQSSLEESAKKKRKKKKTGRYEDSGEITEKTKGIDQTANAMNLQLLSNFDMLPRPFGFSNKQQEKFVQSASENRQTKVYSPIARNKVDLLKISQVNGLKENSPITLNQESTAPAIDRNSYLQRGPARRINEEPEVNKMDVAVTASATDLDGRKIEPLANFVNQLTTIGYGNRRKTSVNVNPIRDEATTVFDIYKTVPKDENRKISERKSYAEFNEQPTSESIALQSRAEILPRSYKILGSDSISRRKAVKDSESVVTSVNPETYEDLSETTVPAFKRKSEADEKGKSSVLTRLESYKKTENSLNPATESSLNSERSTVPLKTANTKVSDTYDGLSSNPYVVSKSYSTAPVIVTSDESSDNSAENSPYLSATTNVRHVDSNELREKGETRGTIVPRNGESSENSAERYGNEFSAETSESGANYGDEGSDEGTKSARIAYEVHENPESDDRTDENVSRARIKVERESLNEPAKSKAYRVHKDVREKYGENEKQDYSNDHREERNREYEDQKVDRTQNHQEHADKAHKDNKKRDEKFEKGGGAEHDEYRHSENGSKGEKAYESEHDHEDKEKGHHDKEHRSNHYGEENGEEKKHHEAGGYHKEHHREEKGQKEATFGEKGEHKKGHSTKGAHVVHKKDEFEKKTEFFDEFHEDGDTEKDGEFLREHEKEKGGHEKSHHVDAGEHEEHHGKKGQHAKGGSHHENLGHNIEEGHHRNYDNERKHGKKAIDEHGKKWGFTKKVDDGDGKKKDH